MRSRSIFLGFTSGEFGRQLVSEYVGCLRHFPDLAAPNISSEYFNISLLAITECWKRFVLPTESFPWTLFTLLDRSTDAEFLRACGDLQSQLTACPKCVDVEFSTPILRFLDVEDAASSWKVRAVKNLLEDLALHAPLSSDLVECRHGICQHLLHRWRGVKPTDAIAAQSVAWQLITRAYGRFREFLWDLYGDKTCKHRLARFGVTSRNGGGEEARSMKAPPKAINKQRLTFEKMDSLLARDQQASFPMPRKLRGDLV